MRNNIIYIFLFIFILSGMLHCEIIKFNDIKVGDKGYGETVFSGVKIDRFNVTVAGKFANTKLDNDLLFPGRTILIELSGETVETFGGVSAGMSGSPIYINGKLIGGLSATWKTEGKSHLALVTPIEDMRKILNYPNLKFGFSNSIFKKFNFKGKIYDGINICLTKRDYKRNFLNFIKTNPFIISDLKSSKSEKELLQKRGIKKIMVSDSFIDNTFKTKPKIKLKPGASFGIQLVRGDFNVTALGTITEISNDKVIGLGHSMLKKGNVNYFLTSAYIYKTVRSDSIPFRLGVPIDLVGSIIQDREKAVLGELNVFPSVIPIKFSCFDNDIKNKKEYIVQIVDDNELLPIYFRSSMLQALEHTSDRVGKGSVNVEMLLRYKTSKSSEIKTMNVNWSYYDNGDFSSNAVNKSVKIVSDLIKNRFEKVNIIDISIKTSVTEKNMTAYIDSVVMQRDAKGEFNVIIKLQPYKIETISYKIPIKIDKETSDSIYHIIVETNNSKETEDEISDSTSVNQNDETSNSKINSFAKFIDNLKYSFAENKLKLRIFKESKNDTKQVFVKDVKIDKFLPSGFAENKFKINSMDN